MRRAFLGAAAATALAPAACVAPRSTAAPQPTKIGQMTQADESALKDGRAVKPTGRLPCSWPREMAQIPINVGDPDYAPLFEYGFGLSW